MADSYEVLRCAVLYMESDITMGTDTIAAIATAMTSSGIGIVRISGDEAVSITDRIIVEMKNQKKVRRYANVIQFTMDHIHDGDEVIDEVMVVLMRGPKSYTREDTVEIDCHGGVYVMKRILETVIKYGARPAEPGEFTKRAFLNGRIDLSQAESVIDVINSKNEFALKSSLSQLIRFCFRENQRNPRNCYYMRLHLSNLHWMIRSTSVWMDYPEKLFGIICG